jgi:sirohydrochlorin ferrochelatase
MHQFAALRHDGKQVNETHVAFLAMAEPRVGEELKRVAAAGWRRVVVQPHLLFDGDLTAALRAQVAQVAVYHPDNAGTDWLVTANLSGGETIDDQALDRLARAAISRVQTAATNRRKSPADQASDSLWANSLQHDVNP